MSYSSTILADSPLAYWKLDETTGATQFADSSGNSHPATISGTPTYSTSYKVDIGSVAFSGSQYGSVATTTGGWLSSTSTYSVEVWFSTTATGTRALVMYDNSGVVPGNATRFFMFYLSNGNVIFNPFNSGGTYVTLTSPLAYNDGIWHHAVGTWDGTTVRLYVDGSQVNSTALSGTSPTGGNWPLTLATGCNGAVGNYIQYSGSLDEVAVYGTVLNSTQVSAHWSAGLAQLPSQTKVEATYTEALLFGTPAMQVETTYTEVLYVGMTAQIESVYSETLLVPPATPAKIEANYLEVLVLPISVQRFVGWGVPR